MTTDGVRGSQINQVVQSSESFEEREKSILRRIQKHYSLKLGHVIDEEEAKEIADNLLAFAKAIYGI